MLVHLHVGDERHVLVRVALEHLRLLRLLGFASLAMGGGGALALDYRTVPGSFPNPVVSVGMCATLLWTLPQEA